MQKPVYTSAILWLSYSRFRFQNTRLVAKEIQLNQAYIQFVHFYTSCLCYLSL